MLSRGEAIEIRSIDRARLLPALEVLRGCWKATTMLWMRAMRLPVLSGVILADWSAETSGIVRAFCRENSFSELLLRIDKVGQRWTARRGGYLVPLSKVGSIVRQLRREKIVTMLLEPASPYQDHYGMAAIIQPENRKVVLEVVGPGFDVSDILRSDVQPHERFELSLPLPGLQPDLLCKASATRTHLIDSACFRRAIEQRLVKIGSRLKSPAFPPRLTATSESARKQLVHRAESFLKRTGQTLLLRNAQDYAPIPWKYVQKFSHGVTELLAGLAWYGIDLGTTSLSASVLGDERLVYWDFFPARMQDTTVLFPREHQKYHKAGDPN